MKKKVVKRIFLSFFILCLFLSLWVFCVDLHVRESTKTQILTPEIAAEHADFDAILVLGCKVREDNTPSDMLRDRLDTALSLFEAGAAPKLLMSGDHGQKEYNEVGVMKAYAVENGVLSEDVFMDHAGFSTYESVYRAKHVFSCRKVLIVTQEYHLHRALYIARSLGLEAVGVSADLHEYGGQTMRDIREILARNKDFFSALFKPLPTHLGDVIAVSGNGDVTNDRDGAFAV